MIAAVGSITSVVHVYVLVGSCSQNRAVMPLFFFVDAFFVDAFFVDAFLKHSVNSDTSTMFVGVTVGVKNNRLQL